MDAIFSSLYDVSDSLSGDISELSDAMVSSVTTRYAKTAANVTTAPANDSSLWGSSYPADALTTEHVWEQIVTNYVTGNPSYSTATEIKDRGVANVVTQYATNTSSSTAPTSGWSDTFPSSIASDSYLWTRNKYLTASGTVDHYSTATIAQNNLAASIATANSNASSAVSTANSAATSADLALRTVTVYYLKKTTTATPAPDDPDWSTDFPEQNFGDHIWTMTRYTYGNSSTGNSTPIEITENDVVGVKTQYALSTSNTTAPTTGWQDTMPAIEQGKYLWTRQVYTKGNSDTSYGTATLALNDLYAAVKGTLVDAKTLYATSAQTATSAPTTGWSETYPSYNDAKGKKVWTKIQYTFSDGHTAESTPTDITETGVMSVETQYYKSTSNTTQTGGSWQNTVPTITPGSDYYLWSRDVYTLQNGTVVNGTATLAMNNIYSKITSNDARITQTETDITAQAQQITTIQHSIGVNLSPFFGHDFNDVKGTDSETDGYWQETIGSAITQGSDGWASYDGSIATSYFSPTVNSAIDFTKLTAVIEITGLTLAGSAYPYIRFQNGSNSQKYQASANTSITENGIYRVELTKSTVASPTRLVRGRITRGTAGDKFNVRISLFEEGYTGSYVPYVTSTNSLEGYIAGLKTAIYNNSSALTVAQQNISSLVEKTETITEEYIKATDASTLIDQKIESYSTQVDQTASDLNIAITAAQSSIDSLGNTYRNEIGTHFNFNADGLDIVTTQSGFKGHFDSDSLDFVDGNGTNFGWVSAEDGVGGNKISIGDSTTKSKRWLIYPNSAGDTLRFVRHS